mgnify:FL=1
MAEELDKKIKKQLLLIWKKFSAAFPVICFFLCLFVGVLDVFGSQYVMIVSLVTVLFQVNYKKRNTLKSLLGISALQLALSFLAYIATLSFPFSMILNLTVPFALIFLKASQFNQLGYFSGLMTFTFLQLMPVDFSGFLVQTVAMLWGLCIFIILVLLFQVRFPKTPGYQTQQRGLLLIGSWLKKQVEGQGDAGETGAEEGKEAPEEELHSLEQKLYVEANQKREKKEIITREGKICLVNIDRRGVLQEGIMENYISHTDYVLNQIQQLLHIRQERHVKKIKEMHYQRWVDNDSELSYLMTRYAKNLSSLYRMVSRHRAGRKVH